MRIFGRKKGRRLSYTKQKLVEDFLPNISLDNDKKLRHVLSLKKHLFLEFGFGHGENIIKLSLNRPDWVFIAIDPFLNGVASLLEKIKKNNISNIHIYHGDGRLFLEKLPKNCRNLKILETLIAEKVAFMNIWSDFMFHCNSTLLYTVAQRKVYAIRHWTKK